MKTLTATALVCALMVLSSATPLLPAPYEDQDENNFLFERSACPGGWTQINSGCVRYIPSARSWADAERNCMSMGAHLASIHSASEYHGIQRVIAAATHDYGEAWVGGSDAHKNGLWLWTDGTKFHYSNWCPGEPNNLFGQACLQINYSGRKCWDDDFCHYEKPFVCRLTSK